MAKYYTELEAWSIFVGALVIGVVLTSLFWAYITVPSEVKNIEKEINKANETINIEKPDDFVMKSVVNKSGNKVFIIQQTDKKMPLETIAKNKGWRMDEMLEEMETIAASGTKLNLDYAISEMLDDEDQVEIIDYFKNCETSSLQVAQEELSEYNFNWEQLKIMRIKFLSEYGM